MGCGSSQSTQTQQQEQPQAERQQSPRVKSQPEIKKAPPSTTSGNEFLDIGIQVHNDLRAKHGAGPLTPSKDLTAFSQKWANHLAGIDKMEHSNNEMRDKECGGAGENLYYCWSSDSNAGVSAKDAVQSWYDEIKDYNFNKPGFAMDTGHFTQVVWKGSRELGMAWAKSPGGSYYVVANYRPAGNYMGEFETNVVPKS